MSSFPEKKREALIEATGILDSRPLPDADFSLLWKSIFIDEGIKDRLLSQAILNFRIRNKINRADLPLHGIILLVGPPGTGKTSLARGLSSVTAQSLRGANFTYIEVEPHSLTSSSLGKSQRAVTDLLGTTISEQAMLGPLIVVLDEVETLAADRSKLSLEANPVDVHRATDAVLAQLDHLASKFPELLFIATSNFPQAIDQAFVSRADLVLQIDPPNNEARRQILRSTLEALSEVYPKVRQIVDQPDFERIVSLSKGLDGRKLRKMIATACAMKKDIALNPNLLTAANVLDAIKYEKEQVRT